jgi:hypothetical protein
MVVERIIIGREPEDLKAYGDKGCIFLGKHIVGKGFDFHLTNPILMDVLRPHVILITGKRGCLSGKTKIFTDHGFKSIKEFDENKDKVYSYNNDKNEFEWEDAELLRYPINEDLIRIDFHDGQSLTLTSEHPLLVFDGKKTIWKKAFEITSKDLIISTTKVPEVKNDKESLRIARLLGFLLSDGTMNIRKGRFKDGRGYWYDGTKRRLRIFDSSPEVVEIAKKDLEEEFNIKAKRYKRSDCNCEVVETKHGKVVRKFIELGVPLGNKAGIIRVPKIVWESSNDFKSNFLNALFSCDGFINKKADNIEYYSKSREFLVDLSLLLRHFNIQCSVRYRKAKCENKYFDNYRLLVSDFTSIENFKRIGFFDRKKAERLISHKFWRARRKKKTIYLNDILFCHRIDNISKVNDIKEVFDLSVPKNHSFIANGIISHNSGKSYTSAVIAEEVTKLPDEVRQNLSCLMIDTMGIFWSMKNPNDRQIMELTEWNLKPRGFDVKIIIPMGMKPYYDKYGISYDGIFSIKPSELSAADWALTFNISLFDSIGILLERIIKKLQGRDYSIEDIISEIGSDKRSDEKEKMILENRFISSKGWGVFSQESASIENFLNPGVVTVLDVSLQETNVRSLMIGILCREIYQARMAARRIEEMELTGGETAKKVPMTWITIDEVHEYLPDEGETPATRDLLTLLRQGRQPGVSLVLITQRPDKIHGDAISQADLVIAHRLTAKPDVEALSAIMQTYLLFDIRKLLGELPKNKGAALILDDNSERIFNIQVRPRQSWHAGESPIALKEKGS